MGGPPQITDRKLYAARRARASGTTFLVQTAGTQLAGRIASFERSFEYGLDLSSRPESFAELSACAARWTRTALTSGSGLIAADEEALPFRQSSFDVITSVISLHAVNDLPGALVQIRRALRPGGLFIAALFAGETLRELRDCFAAAEADLSGGMSARVAPFADVRDLGNLLQRADFSRPVADIERTVVRYAEFRTLLADLRALGETSSLACRSRKFLRRDILAKTLACYSERFAEVGRIRATFDIAYLTGWAEGE